MTDGKVIPRVYLDTNIFIYTFEADPTQTSHLRDLFDFLHSHPKIAVTSELTLAELLASKKIDDASLHIKRRFYLNLMVSNTFIDLQSTNRSIWLETADLRRRASFQLPDAVHVVTAIRAGCKYFVSHDRRLRLPQNLQLITRDKDEITKLLETLRA